MKKRAIPLLVLSSSFITCSVGYGSWIFNEFSENDNISFKPVVCFIGSKYYTSIGKAIEESKSGDVIEVIPGNTNRNSKAYTITTNDASKTVTIPQEVTLKIPYEKGATSKKNADNINDIHALANRSKYCTSTVIVGDGIKLENNGTIEIGGILGAASGGKPSGCTSGKYTELILGDGSELINHNTISVYGLLGEKTKGSSLVTIKPSISGVKPTLNMPMYWYDFGGGSALKAIYDNISSRECIPLDDFYFENITNKTIIYGGSDVISWINLYAASNCAEYDLKLVGNDSNGIISLTDNESYILSNFDETTLYHQLDFYGNAYFNALTIDLKAALGDKWKIANILAGIPSEVSSSQGYFPISYHYQITLNPLDESTSAYFDGSSNKYKLLNGASLKINNGAKLSAKSLVVYKGDDIYTTRGDIAKSLKKSMDKSLYTTAASVIVNGTLSSDTVAGTIDTDLINSTIIVNDSTSTTTYEPKAGSGKRISAAMLADEKGWYYINSILTLKDKDGNYVEKSETGRYVSLGQSNFYWELNILKDIDNVSIVSENGNSTDAGAAKIFNLSAKISPSDYESTNVTYKWTLDNTNGAKLSNNSSESVTLSLDANTGTEDDIYYKVTLVVEYTSLIDGQRHETSETSMMFKAAHKEDSPCFESNTLIETKRGVVKVSEVMKGDMILSYNHFSGKYEYKSIAAVINHGENRYDIMQLSFDDGSQIRFINNHGLFDIELNQYVDFNLDNFKTYVGHHFIKYDTGLNSIVKLVKAELISKVTSSYTLVSSENLNCIANGLLNITSVLKGIYNIFEYDENHNYILDKMNEDIVRYGLYKYSDFEGLITEKIFIDYGFKYFKVSIGKGLMTYDTLLFYINWLKSCINSGEAVIY